MRPWFIVAAMVVVFAAIVAGVVNWVFDPERLTPKLAAAVARTTGMTLTVAGKVGIGLSLNPTVTMDDVSLSNPAAEAQGFSRPEVVKVARIEVTLALGQLFQRRVEIDHITLSRPDILLESDRQGHANWRRAAAAPVKPVETSSFAPGGIRSDAFSILARDIVLTGGRLTIADTGTGQRRSIDIPRLIFAAADDGSSHGEGTIGFEGQTIAATVRAGPLDDLRTANEDAPWPLAFSFDAGGTVLDIDARMAHPLEGRGYVITVDGRLADQKLIASFLREGPFAAVTNATIHAELSDRQGNGAHLAALSLTAKAIDLAGLMRRWKLEDLKLAARGDEPIRIGARLSRPGYDTGLAGTFGDLDWLSHGATGPLTLALDWNAASARGSLKGTVRSPRSLSGFTLDLALDVPDPTLIMDDAPRLKAIVFKASISDAPGPTPFSMTSSAGDLAGQVAIVSGQIPSVTGHVTSESFDLDALRTAVVEAVTPEPGQQKPAPPRNKQAAPDPAGPVISDVPLPFELLRAVDGSVTASIAQVRLAGGEIDGVDATLTLKGGVLRIDPVIASSPKTQATIEVDSTKTPPSVRLTLDAARVSVAPMLEFLGLPPVATGLGEWRANLIGAGMSLHAIAATLDGWSGFAMTGGQLDGRMIDGWMNQIRPGRAGAGEGPDLRCFAVRADVKSGAVTARAALNSAPLMADGDGEFDLGRETMAMRPRPRLRFGGAEIVPPIRVSGPWRTPVLKADLSPAAIGASGILGLLVGPRDTPPAPDRCPELLIQARGDAGVQK